MGRKRTKPGKSEDRVTVLALKDTVDYRAWLDQLSQETLIPVAMIVRDAVARWAADRGLPPPPHGPGSAGRPPQPPKKGGGKP